MIAAFKAAASAVFALEYRWVLAGASGNLWTTESTTFASWTSRTSSFSTTQINDVCANGTDMYVAVGDDGKLATSPDGITWTQRTSSFGATNIYNVSYGDGIWVAVGEDGKIATATDPTGTWTQRTSGTANDLDGVRYGASIWVAKGTANTVLSAPDPTSTWTSRTNAISTTGFENSLSWLPDQSLFAIGGGGTELATSTDGITWTAQTTDQASLLTKMTMGIPGIIVAVGPTANNTVADSSPDAVTWTSRTIPWIVGTSNTQAESIARDNGGRIAVAGYYGITGALRIMNTTNGTSWTDRTAPTAFSSPLAFCHSSGRN